MNFFYLSLTFFICCNLTQASADVITINNQNNQRLLHSGSLAILPEDGRQVYFDAFAAAQCEIRIEICVLEDPLILQSLNEAINRGIHVRVIVDKRKYEALPTEQNNLFSYLTQAGGLLHLSNPIFPRSFPKMILIDDRHTLIGTACLDTTTFEQYRDYVYASKDEKIIKYMSKLFENDWLHSAHPGQTPTVFNPTPTPIEPNILVAPVNSVNQLVSMFHKACKTLDITSELLGNPILESELAAAVSRNVRVRLIAPKFVNGATSKGQALQLSSLRKLQDAGVEVHITLPPETSDTPYMHARTALADGKIAYIGSISLSPNSTTFNRGVGVIIDDKHTVKKLQHQFNVDFNSKSHNF